MSKECGRNALRSALALLFCLCIASAACGQMYGDPSLVRPDTSLSDTAEAIILEEAVPETLAGPSAFEQAKLWTRRLLLRGVLNTNHIGAFAEYQLTDWSLVSGSMGPVRLNLKVVYLGSASFMGQEAEWVQASVRVFGETDTRILFDFLFPSRDKREAPLRTLVKEEGQSLREISLALPAGAPDYDAMDNPRDIGEKLIELSHGKYSCRHFRGAGDNGAEVHLFLSPEVNPYGVVVMGYGDEGLTLIRKGADATPLLDVPPPPTR
ncbi:MAG: hypothetical protein V1784_04005 [bacterium]